MKLNTKDITICAVFTAIMCILSVITIPIGAVPITLSLFALFLLSMTLECKHAIICTILYILIGAFGIPVFSGFKAGIGVLLGPTGGYIWSYPIIALIISIVSNKSNKPLFIGISAVIALIVCYTVGTAQFTIVYPNPMTFVKALSICVYPFVIFDIIKLVLALFISKKIKSIIYKEN